MPLGIKTFIENIERENISDEDLENESKMEAILTYYDRMHIKDVEKNKFLSAFATKRYDVIAVNRGLSLTIPVSSLCAIGLKIVSLNSTPKELSKLFGCINFLLRNLK